MSNVINLVGKMGSTKSIAFPEITDFNELVSSYTVIENLHSYKSRSIKVWETTRLSSFCSSRGGECLDVEPSDKVVEFIETNMILSDYQVINLNLVNREDGKTLVMASYNSILGSRWLAVVDSKTVPGVHNLKA